MRDLDVLAGQLQRVRHVKREVEQEPVPRIQRGDGVHLREVGRLGGVRLEQRPLEDLVDLQIARLDSDVARHLRLFEAAAELE